MGVDGPGQAWETPLNRASLRSEDSSSLSLGGPAQLRLARLVVRTCLNHLLAAYMPPLSVQRAFDKITRSVFGGPAGWIAAVHIRHLDKLGLRALPPDIHEMSLRLRLLVLLRRKLWQHPMLFKMCKDAVYHEELPLMLGRWFACSYLAALHDVCMAAVQLGFYSLRLDVLTARSTLVKSIACKGRLRKLLIKHLSAGDWPYWR